MQPNEGAIWRVALIWQTLATVTANNHLYDGSGGNEGWWPAGDCYGSTCSGVTNFCCDDIQQCCSEIQYHFSQVGIDEEEATTTSGIECYNSYCNGHERYCCELYKSCCNYFTYMLTNRVSHDNTKYPGQKVRCTVPWGGYGEVTCPPDYDHEKLYCCSKGHRCCTSAQKSSEDMRIKQESDSSNNMGIGAIAGFVFMGVIVVATVLTLVTRYVKIKVRRHPPSRAINSTEHREAANRQLNNNVNNTQRPQGLPGMTYPANPRSQTYSQTQDEDLVNPPPSYDEVMASSPVTSDNPQETSNSTQVTERQPRAPDRRLSPRLNNQGISRPSSHASDSHELQTFIKVRRSNQDRHKRSLQQESSQISIPKPDDSYA